MINILKQKRELFRLELESFEKWLEPYNSDTPKSSLERRLAKLDFSTFREEQPELDIADGTYFRKRLDKRG